MMELTIVVETPANSHAKYIHDADTGSYRLKKLLPLGMVFPYDFGYIPATKGEDGDPLDALIISEFITYPGVQVRCRLIGALLAGQSEKGKTFRNDRFFFIPVDSVVYRHITAMHQFGTVHNSQLRDFFINYNKAVGKIFRPLKMVNAAAASRLIKKSAVV